MEPEKTDANPEVEVETVATENVDDTAETVATGESTTEGTTEGTVVEEAPAA